MRGLQLVFSKLDDPLDLFRLSAVCRDWRTGATTTGNPGAWGSARLKTSATIKRYVKAQFAIAREDEHLERARETVQASRLARAFVRWRGALASVELADQGALRRRLRRRQRRMLEMGRAAIKEVRRGYYSTWHRRPQFGAWADAALGKLVARAPASSLRSLNLAHTDVSVGALSKAYEENESLQSIDLESCWALLHDPEWPALRSELRDKDVTVKDRWIVAIKVRGQDGTEVYFKIRSECPLKKLMDVYAQRQGGTTNAYRFIFDGNRIVETQTPFNLQMENDDVIDAMLEQRGD